MPVPSSYYSIPDLFIDPIAGDNKKRGDDPARARLTVESWMRDVGNVWEINRVTTLHVQTASIAGQLYLQAGDLLRLNVRLTKNGFLRVQGQPFTVASGNFTAGTANANFTTTTSIVEDTTNRSGGWAAFVGKRIRVPANGKIAWILADVGGGSARALVNQPCSPTSAVVPVPALFSETPFAVGEAYVIEDLCMAKVMLEATSPFDRTGTSLNDCYGTIEGFHGSTTNGSNNAELDVHNFVRGTNSTVFHTYGCKLRTFNVDSPSTHISWGCNIGNTQCRGGFWAQYACFISGDNLVQAGGMVWIDFDTIAYGAGSGLIRSRLGGTVRIGAAASFNGAATGLRVLAGGNATMDLAQAGTTRLWGTGNATAGTLVEPGCTLALKAGVTPTISGPGGNGVQIGNLPEVTPWASCPASDDDARAAVVYLP